MPPIEEDEEELRVPMQGYLWPVGVSIREENAFVSVEDGKPVVGGICGFALTICGEPVFMPDARDMPPNARDALIYLAYLVDRFLSHPVRWWDRASWEGRSVLYRGERARVIGYRYLGGIAELDTHDGTTVWVPWNATDVEWSLTAPVDSMTESQE